MIDPKKTVPNSLLDGQRCDDGADDDLDGLIDCADSDCASFPGCP